MIKNCTLFFLLILSLNLQAQEENYTPPQGLNNWYVELGGAALLYSVNYEKYLYRNQKENFTWLGRIGIGFNPIDFPAEHKLLNKVELLSNSFMVPFTTTILKGAGKEKLEFGAGFTMITKNFLDREIVPNLVFGLRVMETNRVCFRITYIPLYKNNEIIHWVGVSIGRNFNFK
ncbi:MAG: hypothetical protein H7296_04065 [Bacteroidia bacterium]|nr:hypothetical protein [Bacteroidia bacterium]